MKTLPTPDNIQKPIEESIDEWKALAAPVEKVLNLTLFGFCPNFEFIDNEEKLSHVYMSVSLVKRIVNLINKQ